MKYLAVIVIVSVTIAFSFGSCKSGGPPTFCDTTCMKDTLKFTETNHRLRPYVYISPKDCLADTIMWSYDGMGVNRKLEIPDVVGSSVHLNKNFVRCVFNDTSYAWVLFNNCDGGRGYYLKIPFSKTKNIQGSNRAINNIDKKFSIADNLVSYIDPGNIFVEDMTTGKTGMMTFGKDVKPDYANIHNTIDSVNITADRIWVKVKIDNEWKEKEKKIGMK